MEAYGYLHFASLMLPIQRNRGQAWPGTRTRTSETADCLRTGLGVMRENEALLN